MRAALARFRSIRRLAARHLLRPTSIELLHIPASGGVPGKAGYALIGAGPADGSGGEPSLPE